MIKEEPANAPEDGALIWGLFFEGAKFNYDTMMLDESDPKVKYKDSYF